MMAVGIWRVDRVIPCAMAAKRAKRHLRTLPTAWLFYICLCIAGTVTAASTGGRIYDECETPGKATWIHNIKVIADKDAWVSRQGDIYRYALDDASDFGWLVYQAPEGARIKSIKAVYYSAQGLAPTLVVKTQGGSETKYSQVTGNAPKSISMGGGVNALVLDSSIPDDANQAGFYLDARSDVEILRMVVEYGTGYEQPDYNAGADFGRLQRFLAKAVAGRDLTIGVIGGSITAGANAEPMAANCYGARIKQFLESKFRGKVTLINAGIGSTNSFFGVIRADDQLLKYHPDLVLIDYAVNNGTEAIFQQTYEGLIRKILKSPGAPALLAVMFCTQAGITKQEDQIPIAQYYRVPVVPYADTVKNNIIDGGKNWLDYYATLTLDGGDGVHPNTAGHQLAADLVAAMYNKIQPNREAAVAAVLPASQYSPAYDNAYYLSKNDISPERTGTWVDGGAIWDFHTGKGWRSVKKNSELVFSITGELAAMTYWKRPAGEGYGRAQVWVDNGQPVEIDGSNGEALDQIAFTGLGGGSHKLHIKTLDDKPFEIVAIAVSRNR
jgi:lysophospholipase L1-like esterase